MGKSIVTRRTLVNVPIVLLLVGLFIGSVNARGGSFIVGPKSEVTENVVLDTSNSVYGNVSVDNGFVDFFVTSPSGDVLLRYAKTSLNSFNFTATEKGTYQIHAANTYRTEAVNITLNYMVAVSFQLSATLKVSEGVSVGTATVLPPSMVTQPLDWIIPIIGWVLNLLMPLANALLKFLRWLSWIKRYRKSRTPVSAMV